MSKLTRESIEELAMGAALLGSGGGGDPYIPSLLAAQLMEEPIELVSPSALSKESFVMPLAFVGAPIVAEELLPSGREFFALRDAVEEEWGCRVTHLISGEIGGGNAFVGPIAASLLGLPLLDGDMLGRAFPKLSMSSCCLNGISASPAFIADSHGEVRVCRAPSPEEIERLCRTKIVELGGTAIMALYCLSGSQVTGSLVENSMSYACQLGRALGQARVRGSLEPLLHMSGGIVLAKGTIVRVDSSLQEGFLSGSFLIEREEGGFVEVLLQNEFLAVLSDGNPMASTPEIIIPLERESFAPITSEKLLFGLSVLLLRLPSPPIWRTQRGLAMVGPEVFGYSFSYEEVSS